MMKTSTALKAIPRVAVLIPCYQEEPTVGKVVTDFRRQLPDAEIYVYDNNSTDKTAEQARKAGAIVRKEKRQGKGYVVASMLEQVDADIYVLVDGDDTYHAPSVKRLIAALLAEEADMIVASRLSAADEKSFRRFHQFGNQMVCRVINLIFRSNIRDIFSGYRAMTRELAKSVPVIARGYDVETELTLQALYRRYVIKEITAPYGLRPEGSTSKLRTVPDGLKVLLRMFLLFQSYKPLTLFGGAAILAFICALLAGYTPVAEYIDFRYVYSVPRAVLAAALMTISLLSAAVGIILHSVNFRLLEVEKILLKHAGRVPQSGLQTTGGRSRSRRGRPGER
jgi:glycosyltransferase involved in cell wall biosynthesis